MRKSGGSNNAMVVAGIFALVILVLDLVAIIRCPAAEIPQVLQALGSWLHVSIRV
jgi:hypothetical protein